MQTLLSAADRALGRPDGAIHSLPEADLLVLRDVSESFVSGEWPTICKDWLNAAANIGNAAKFARRFGSKPHEFRQEQPRRRFELRESFDAPPLPRTAFRAKLEIDAADSTASGGRGGGSPPIEWQ